VSQQDAYNKCVGAVKTMWTPPPLSRVTSPSLIVVCLRLAYSKLWKLMVTSNAGGI